MLSRWRRLRALYPPMDIIRQIPLYSFLRLHPMALSSVRCCRSSSFFASSSVHQGGRLFNGTKFAFVPSSLILAGPRVSVMKCSNGHLIPLENGLGDNSATEEPTKHFEVSEDQFSSAQENSSTVSIIVVGASGDLARKKIFPALFALYYEGFLPKHFTIFGYSRSKLTDDELREMICKTLTCRIDKRKNCTDKMEWFLQRCFYQSGQYDSEENFKELDEKLKEKETGRLPNRLFYLSIPPNIFIDVVRCASCCATSPTGWTRVIVEKPFGRDSNSSRKLTSCLKQYLTEDQIFRIDHYLGKELVENLSVLRFSNLVFEPLWSRQYIRNVQLIFSEDFGTEGRGGYVYWRISVLVAIKLIKSEL
ncbi:hypothetical protein HPP92_023599 [Vanilla planifolia]|uniref:glucose-6-phosphate dehydrogenase (NADP(+)) n=1 Tax=Vanilla planifolia TaxID=51239 RepID=A0A835PYU5_VANPL|nr:hypothetical protein HPP92_023599 [Vanilla planifolia]